MTKYRHVHEKMRVCNVRDVIVVTVVHFRVKSPFNLVLVAD